MIEQAWIAFWGPVLGPMLMDILLVCFAVVMCLALTRTAMRTFGAYSRRS